MKRRNILPRVEAALTDTPVVLVNGPRAGRIVAVEVKSSASFGKRDTAGLRALAEDLGERFYRGVLLYGGGTVVPIGSNLDASVKGSSSGASSAAARLAISRDLSTSPASP